VPAALGPAAGDLGPVGLGGTPRALARLVSLFNSEQKKRPAQWRAGVLL
jgi:hypothetical protein